MNINSPEFVRRKVLNSNNNVYDQYGSKEKPKIYQLGSERILLSKHVTDRLNSHDQDIEILQKFRKQAVQLKRKNFQSKKQKAFHELQPREDILKSNLYSSSKKTIQFPKLQYIATKTIEEPIHEAYQQENAQEYVRRNPNVVKQSQYIIKKLNKKLKQKDKKMQKKNVKLKKSEKIIEEMAHKIDLLKRERQLAVKTQELQLQKINVFIEEMNYKMAENRIMFRQELLKLKSEVGLFSSFKTIETHSQAKDSHLQSLGNKAKTDRNRRIASQKLINFQLKYEDVNPSIKYDSPMQRNYSQKPINSQKSIENSLIILKRNKNSISRILQPENPEIY